jgi:hypothetical protein
MTRFRGWRRSLPGRVAVGGRCPGVLLTVARGHGGRLSDQRGVGTVGRRGPLGQDDGAGLVR